MKKILQLFLFSLVLLTPFSCQEISNPIESQIFSATPIIKETKPVTAISQNTAVSGGNIISTKGKNIIARGVCWNTSKIPFIQNKRTVDGKVIGEFTSNLTDLTANTTYYVRSYVQTDKEVAYGTEVSFKTLEALTPTVTTTVQSEVTGTTAKSGGTVVNSVGSPIASRGICWNTLENPTNVLSTKTSNGTGLGAFTSDLTGLTGGTKYYIRAYAVNAAGKIGYGSNVSFTTATVSPTITTVPVSDILPNSAKSGGTITYDGGAAITSKGVVWSTASAPTTTLTSKTNEGPGNANFTSLITNLKANTKYYYRAYAINNNGQIGYGNEVSFTTTNNPPAEPLNPNPSHNSIDRPINLTLNWSCTDPDSDALTYDVYFGTGSNATITISTNKSAQNIGLSGLANLTTYYWKIVAKDSKGGSTESPIWSFITEKELPTVTDIDGNIYHAVTIGTQVWMVENLKTTKYRNGDLIPNGTDGTAWSNLTTGAYCNYDNNENNADSYGRLYNWYAVNDSRNIAPTGWHVATDDEWLTLRSFVGGGSVAGTKLKSITGWNSNGNGTDEYGFTAFPGGRRDLVGSFGLIGASGYWWTSTVDSGTAWRWLMDYQSSYVDGGRLNKKYGYSVRCIKD